MAALEKGKESIPASIYLSPIAPLDDTDMEKYSKVLKYYNIKMQRSGMYVK